MESNHNFKLNDIVVFKALCGPPKIVIADTQFEGDKTWVLIGWFDRNEVGHSMKVRPELLKHAGKED